MGYGGSLTAPPERDMRNKGPVRFTKRLSKFVCPAMQWSFIPQSRHHNTRPSPLGKSVQAANGGCDSSALEVGDELIDPWDLYFIDLTEEAQRRVQVFGSHPTHPGDLPTKIHELSRAILHKTGDETAHRSRPSQRILDEFHTVLAPIELTVNHKARCTKNAFLEP